MFSERRWYISKRLWKVTFLLNFFLFYVHLLLFVNVWKLRACDAWSCIPNYLVQSSFNWYLDHITLLQRCQRWWRRHADLLQLQVVPTILIQAVRTEQVATNLSSLTCCNLILQSICNKNKMASSFHPVIQTIFVPNEDAVSPNTKKLCHKVLFNNV
jgi:hypothetical protein